MTALQISPSGSECHRRRFYFIRHDSMLCVEEGIEHKYFQGQISSVTADIQAVEL